MVGFETGKAEWDKNRDICLSLFWQWKESKPPSSRTKPASQACSSCLERGITFVLRNGGFIAVLLAASPEEKGSLDAYSQ